MKGLLELNLRRRVLRFRALGVQVLSSAYEVLWALLNRRLLEVFVGSAKIQHLIARQSM